jgi:hypothetical protein
MSGAIGNSSRRMAKTESTAVNELIDRMQGRPAAPPSDADDLFASMHPPRMTSTVPPMFGAGEVAPLPRGRAPQSTAEHSIPHPSDAAAAQAADDAVLPRVRMRPASPARGTTIPPLSRRTAAAGTVAPPVRASQANTSRQSRPSGPPLPPPGRSSSPSSGAIGRARTSSPDVVTRTLDPALPPLTRKSAAAGTVPPPVATRANLPASAPIAAPFESHDVDVSPFAASPFSMPAQFPVLTPPDASTDHWYESRPSAERLQQSETRALIKKLIAPALLVIAAGIVIGAVIATGRQKHATPQKPVTPTVRPSVPSPDEELVVRPSLPRAESDNAGTASAGAAEPQPPTKAEQAAQMAAAAANGMTQDAPKAAVEALEQRAPAAGGNAPAVREVQTKHGVVKFVDVRIDSDPAGATVTLVDGGKQSFLGSTPLSTSVEASRAYDVIVALDGRPTQMVHLDPATTSRLDVSLGGKPAAVSSTRTRRTRAALAPAMPVTSPSSDTNLEPTSENAVEAVAKTGTLRVSSKPPCELVIDGEATGLTTPQRSIELRSGSHEITFKNDASGISKTVSVKITGGQVTKLIQDLMAQP